jgi:hypothetical protein
MLLVQEHRIVRLVKTVSIVSIAHRGEKAAVFVDNKA